MNDEHKEKIYYIQQQADELSAEISKLMRKDADLSEKHLNDLIKLGVFISIQSEAYPFLGISSIKSATPARAPSAFSLPPVTLSRLPPLGTAKKGERSGQYFV